MANKLLKIFSLFILLLSFGCEYEFSDDFFNEIELIEPSGSLSLSNFKDGDTLRDTKNIEYTYSAPDSNRLYEIQFYVNDILVDNYVEQSIGSFSLNIENLANGDHTLRVEYYFKTNSGSLAEVTGVESYVKIEEFSFIVDKTAVALEIDRIEHINGTIFVHFKDYSLIDDIGESLTSTLLIYDELDQLIGQLDLTKAVIESGSINDNISLDTNLRYITRIENSFGFVDSEAKEITIPYTFNLKVSSTANDEFYFKWPNHPLYNNIKSALLVYDKYGYRDEVNIDMSANELVYDAPFDNFVFGRTYEYRLELIANNNSLSYYQTPRKNIEGEFYRGEIFQVNNYKKFLYNELSDKLYALSLNNDGTVYIDELNANTLVLVKRNFITNSNNTIGDFSFNDNKNFIIDLNTKSIEVNSNSFQVIKEYNISEFNNQAQTSTTIVRFRENTFAIDDVENFKTVLVYDIPSKALLIESYRAKSNTFNFSANGDYFNVNNKIYNKTGTTLSEVYSDEFGRELHTDYSTETNKVYLAAGYIREIGLLTSSINQIPDHSNMDEVEYIPSQNKTLSMHSEYYLVFFDLNTNQTDRKRIEIKDDSYFYLAQKNFLISPYGYFIKNYQ